MRRQIVWWWRGHAHTQAALDEHTAAIRDLQHQVAELTDALARIDPLASKAADDVAGLPAEIRAAVDDLGARLQAVTRRLDEGGS